jgi:hypothetical protein
MTSIEAFIPEYPSRDQTDFFINIAKKAEFEELTLDSFENPEKNDLLAAQKFAQRMFSPYTPYSEAAYFHQPGTGKTCVASAIKEGIKSGKISRQKPALILVKNEVLIQDFMTKIAKVCTHEIYKPNLTDEEALQGVEISAKAKKGRLKRSVNAHYQIETHHFVIDVMKSPNKNIIAEKYSGRVIVIDEAHLINEQTFGDQEDKKKANESYNLYLEFTHMVKNSIIILLTGTPIWDQAYGIASLMNLILPLYQALPTGNKFYKKFFPGGVFADSEGTLKNAFRGRVSVLRNIIDESERIERGIVKPLTKLMKVYPNVMSEFQAKWSKEARFAEEIKTIKGKGGKKIERKTIGGPIDASAIAASVMVYPEVDFKTQKLTGSGRYDTSYFNKISTKEGKKGYHLHPLVSKELKDNLPKYSAKIASIVDQVLSHPNHIFFIYCDKVSGVGGAISIALCLENSGLIWFRGGKSEQAITLGLKRPPEDGKRRLAVITSKEGTIHESAQVLALLDAMNDPENKHGKYLQVIIGSKKVLLGITIKNARQVHIISPHWNVSSFEQAEARVFRYGSHNALPIEERKVEIFRHVSVLPGSYKIPRGEGYPKGAEIQSEQKYKSAPQKEPIDLYIMKIAEEKLEKIFPIERLYKQEAFDCVATYKRNVLITDIEGSKECNFQECNYQCDGVPPPDKSGKVWDYSKSIGKLDYSTYNLFYSSERVKEIISLVSGALRFENNYTLKRLQQELELQNHEIPLLLQAIDILINSRTIVRNRLGFGCYVKYDSERVFLDFDIESYARFPRSNYTKNLLLSKFTTFEEQVSMKELEADISNLKKFCDSPNNENVKMFSFETKVLLFEKAFEESWDTPDLPQIKVLLDDFQKDYFETFDGKWIHIAYITKAPKVTQYSADQPQLRSEGKTRVYNHKSTKGERWSWVSNRELEEQYLSGIKSLRTKAKEIMLEESSYGLFGIVDSSGKFKISKKGKSDRSRQGMAGTSFSLAALKEILIKTLHFSFRSSPPPSSIDDKAFLKTYESANNLKRDELVQQYELLDYKNEYLSKKELRDIDTEELRAIYVILSISSKVTLVELIRTFLDSKGLVVYN